MRRALGHNVMTVEDLITELRKFDPTYEVGINLRGLIGYSVKEIIPDHANGVLDIGLQMSYDPLRGFLGYNDFGDVISIDGKPVGETPDPA